MDGYQLTAVIFQSLANLAWPAALCIVVWMFRSKLLELLPGVRVKHKDWEASFRLDKAEQEMAELKPPAGEVQEPAASPEERNRFEEMVALSPRGALLEARAELEEGVQKFAEVNGFAAWTRKGAPMRQLVVGLRDRGIIDEHMSAALDDLRSIGNRAAHSSRPEVSPDEARRFKKLADEVVLRMWQRVH